jgi:transcriptional repressor NrdR
MKCPYCGEDNDKVVDSRSMNEGQSIRRRRECLACAKRFTTYEHVDSIAVMVIKRDRRREPYSREKLVEGVRLSCRKRPVSEDQIEEVASQVEMKINSRFEKEIESATLGDLVMDELRRLDQVAYVRFASVYRQFKDVSVHRRAQGAAGYGSPRPERVEIAAYSRQTGTGIDAQERNHRPGGCMGPMAAGRPCE